MVETGPIAYALLHTCRECGIQIPADLSLGLLGDPFGDVDGALNFSGFSIPREEMGAQAVYLLAEGLDAKAPARPRQIALPCTPVAGSTIAPPPTHP